MSSRYPETALRMGIAHKAAASRKKGQYQYWPADLEKWVEQERSAQAAFCPGAGPADNSCSSSEGGSNPQTDTPKFKKWFGDSKVVDADGNPAVVYHGTNKDFAKFDKNAATMGGITWFTSNPAEASDYAMQTPDKTGANVKPLYVRIENPAGWDEYQKLGLGELKARGFDGSILKDPDGSFSGFAFDPKQFKSATGNSGKFDPKKADIRASAEVNRQAELAWCAGASPPDNSCSPTNKGDVTNDPTQPPEKAAEKPDVPHEKPVSKALQRLQERMQAVEVDRNQSTFAWEDRDNYSGDTLDLDVPDASEIDSDMIDRMQESMSQSAIRQVDEKVDEAISEQVNDYMMDWEFDPPSDFEDDVNKEADATARDTQSRVADLIDEHGEGLTDEQITEINDAIESDGVDGFDEAAYALPADAPAALHDAIMEAKDQADSRIVQERQNLEDSYQESEAESLRNDFSEIYEDRYAEIRSEAYHDYWENNPEVFNPPSEDSGDSSGFITDKWVNDQSFTGSDNNHLVYNLETPGGKYDIQVTESVKELNGNKYNNSYLAFFDENGSVGQTGAGHGKELFDKVSVATAALVNKTKPDILTFSAAESEDTELNTKTTESRRDLYAALVSRALRLNPDYAAVKIGDGTFAVYNKSREDELKASFAARHPDDQIVQLSALPFPPGWTPIAPATDEQLELWSTEDYWKNRIVSLGPPHPPKPPTQPVTATPEPKPPVPPTVRGPLPKVPPVWVRKPGFKPTGIKAAFCPGKGPADNSCSSRDGGTEDKPADSQKKSEVAVADSDITQGKGWSDDIEQDLSDYAQDADGIRSVLDHYGAEKVEFMGNPIGVYTTSGGDILEWDGVSDDPLDVSITKESDASQFVYDYDLQDEEAKYEDDFNKQFWDGPGEVYHATPSDNIESIKQNGIGASEETRGMSNRNVGPAVYTTADPDEAADGSYGDAVFAIDLAAMARDGVTPYVSQEPDVSQGELRGELASAIGLDNFEYDWESDMSPNTIVFHGSIPAKYVRLVE